MSRFAPSAIRATAARKLGEWQHARAARHIIETPPLRGRDDGLILFSMVGTATVVPYLVAIKSVHRELQRGRVMLLNDGSLTHADRTLLATHCDRPTIVELGDVETGVLPRGNCWERLSAILDLRAAHYVIQIDSDVVAMAPIPEVIEAIDQNRSFTLSGGVAESRHGFKSAGETVAIYYQNGPPSDHVQHQAEAALSRMEHAQSNRYIRGCAAFSGFSRSPSGRDAATRLSTFMERQLGAKWQDWGSEQVASNYVIANDPDPLQLPYDAYVNHWAEPLPSAPRLVHFIGTYRYARGDYLRATQAAIQKLNG